MRLTKIYTKIGDRGTTMLANGETVQKDDLRIESYGEVDELNSHLGLLKDFIKIYIPADEAENLLSQISRIQNELFDIGGELATPSDVLNLEKQQVITEASINRLESEIDQINSKLQPLENFVIPGGHICNSQAHIARTVCRRAERNLVKYLREKKSRPIIQIYINRLSDLLFVMSRELSRLSQSPETLWRQDKGSR